MATPITAEIEPRISGAIIGDMTVTITDANLQVTSVLDSGQLNSITVNWQISGPVVPNSPPGTDKYTVKAYFESLEAGGTDTALDTAPAGPQLISTGLLVGNLRTFGPLSIPIAPAAVPKGIYALTVVLSSEAVPPPVHAPMVFGFVDCGAVQFF